MGSRGAQAGAPTWASAFVFGLGLAAPGEPAPPSPATAVESGEVAAGPFRLRYVIEGTGRPTIVIGSAVFYPRVFSRDLRKHLRLVFLDQRGFAPSPGPVEAAELALEAIVDDVERARRQLAVGPVVVVGHSGHAYMALEYAKKYPASVSHVVMIGIAPDLGLASAEAAERYWQEPVSPERKAVLEENRRRVPDAELAALPAGQRFIRGYVRNGPRIWYDPRFDASPIFAGVEVNMQLSVIPGCGALRSASCFVDRTAADEPRRPREETLRFARQTLD